MSTQPFRLAVIGAGGISRGQHIPNWKKIPGVEIAAIVDIQATAAEQVAADHGIPHVFTSVEQMLEKVKPDAVDVCTPNLAHTPSVLAALEAGAHVMCEKPLAVTTAEVRKMGELADAKGKILMTAQMMRFNPAARTIKKWIDAGNIGEVYHSRVYATRRNLIPPRPSFLDPNISGGGPCVDIGVHALDTAMFLLDFPEPVAVSGVTRRNFGGNHVLAGAWGEWDREHMLVEDFACGQIRFADGSTMHLESSWLGHQEQNERMEAQLLGIQGAVNWPNATYSTVSNQVMSDGKLIIAGGGGSSTYGSGYEAEVNAFHQACLVDGPSPVPWQQTFRVISILEGIYTSAKEGREIEAARL